ncbi:MAG TPA: phosphatase PAP2 family protein [Solirubrobacterales bacterium]|nr:phosphatase PAP2 family protein [Solirubrobacterales bacterium]
MRRAAGELPATHERAGAAGQSAAVGSDPRAHDALARELDEAATGARRRRRLTAAALAAFVAVSGVVVALNGVFLSRDIVFLWVLAGLFAVSLSDISGYVRGVLTDWLPFFGMLFLYDLLRGTLADSLFTPHTFPQIRADELLFGGEVPTVWLQERLFDPASLAWYDFLAWAVYLTHFFAVFLIAAYLWRRARPRFLRFRNLILAVTAAAFVTYVAFPAVPPWLATENGDLGATQRVVGAVWSEVGVGTAAAIWEKGSTFANEVAAIPSLHTAYPVMILLFFWPTGSARVRALCLTYALAMSLTLVYTAEHYVIDVILGWVWALGAYWAVGQISSRWRSRARAGPDADLA